MELIGELGMEIVEWRAVVYGRLTLGHFEAGAGDDGVGGEGTTGPLQAGFISMDKYSVA